MADRINRDGHRKTSSVVGSFSRWFLILCERGTRFLDSVNIEIL